MVGCTLYISTNNFIILGVYSICQYQQNKLSASWKLFQKLDIAFKNDNKHICMHINHLAVREYHVYNMMVADGY